MIANDPSPVPAAPAPTGTPSPAGPLVVGVDGSEASIHALQWAVAEADRTGAGVQAIYVYVVATGRGWPAHGPWPRPTPSEWEVVLSSAQEELDRAVRRAVGAAPVVPLSTLVIPDASPASGLARIAATATMLVIGSHRSSVMRRIPGSTTTLLLDTAPCPVVVVTRNLDQVADLQSEALVTA